MLERTTLLQMGREDFLTSTEEVPTIARNLVGLHDSDTLVRRGRWFAGG